MRRSDSLPSAGPARAVPSSVFRPRRLLLVSPGRPASKEAPFPDCRSIPCYCISAFFARCALCWCPDLVPASAASLIVRVQALAERHQSSPIVFPSTTSTSQNTRANRTAAINDGSEPRAATADVGCSSRVPEARDRLHQRQCGGCRGAPAISKRSILHETPRRVQKSRRDVVRVGSQS